MNRERSKLKQCLTVTVTCPMMFRSHLAEEAECKLQEQQHQSFEVSVPYKLYYHAKAVVCEGTAVLYPASFTIECGHARMKFMHPCQECVLETPTLETFAHLLLPSTTTISPIAHSTVPSKLPFCDCGQLLYILNRLSEDCARLVTVRNTPERDEAHDTGHHESHTTARSIPT
jgi:hypothetical protein